MDKQPLDLEKYVGKIIAVKCIAISLPAIHQGHHVGRVVRMDQQGRESVYYVGGRSFFRGGKMRESNEKIVAIYELSTPSWESDDNIDANVTPKGGGYEQIDNNQQSTKPESTTELTLRERLAWEAMLTFLQREESPRLAYAIADAFLAETKFQREVNNG